MWLGCSPRKLPTFASQRLSEILLITLSEKVLYFLCLLDVVSSSCLSLATGDGVRLLDPKTVKEEYENFVKTKVIIIIIFILIEWRCCLKSVSYILSLLPRLKQRPLPHLQLHSPLLVFDSIHLTLILCIIIDTNLAYSLLATKKGIRASQTAPQVSLDITTTEGINPTIIETIPATGPISGNTKVSILTPTVDYILWTR